MNDLKIFSNSEFGDLGVLTIEGKEYFPATACAKTLGYTNPKKAIIDHCKGVTKRYLPTAGGEQEVNFISEGDLYRLIVRSKLPGATRFESWVFDEVLPTLRKQGAYAPELGAIIAQTVQATVGEVIRQLTPLLVRAEPEQETFVPAKHRHPCPSLVDRLEPELRQTVEDMILSRRYTLCEVRAYLKNVHGISISQSSMHRHAQKLYAYEEG